MTIREKVGRRRYIYVQPFIHSIIKDVISKYDGKVVYYKGQRFIFIKHFDLENCKQELQDQGLKIKRVSGSLKTLYKKLRFN